MSTYSNKLRVGNITSSEIHRLMKPGKSKGSFSVDADSYIQEINRERRLMRPIEIETDARPLSWGRCVERRVFDLLPLEYTLCSDQTIQHPTIDYWCGSPDATTEILLAEVKAPLTLTSFCQMVDPWFDKDSNTWYDGLTIEALRGGHRDGDKFFWQCTSNAILTGKKMAQIAVYVPYEDEIEEIKLLSEGIPEFYWIWANEKEKMPYLIRDGHYKNLNLIEWYVMQRDIDALTERVLECGKKLIPWPKPIEK